MEPWEPIDKLESRAFDSQTQMMKPEEDLEPDEVQEYHSVLIGFDLDDPYGNSICEVITGDGQEADEELGRMIVEALKRSYGEERGDCPKCDGPLYVDRIDAVEDVAHCDDCGTEIPGDIYREIIGLKDKQSGAGLIAAERMRQIQKEGWTPEHDDQHEDDELSMAAALYAAPEPLFRIVKRPAGVQWEDPWPWHDTVDVACRGECPVWGTEPAWDKRKKHSRLRRLVIAGALIAAEIDRLQRQENKG